MAILMKLSRDTMQGMLLVPQDESRSGSGRRSSAANNPVRARAIEVPAAERVTAEAEAEAEAEARRMTGQDR